MSDSLQTAYSAPSFNISVHRHNSDNSFENFPFLLPSVSRITLDRRWNMAADELQVELENSCGFLSPDYSHLKSFSAVHSLPKSGFSNVLRPFNSISCDLGYDDNLIRVFSGQIQNVNILESPPAILFNALNSFRKLLKPIDTVDSRQLSFTRQSAFSIVKHLCNLAGIDSLVYDLDSLDSIDYAIEKLVLPFGTSFASAISDILAPINRRVSGGRYGEINILRAVDFSQKDFHFWEFDDFFNLSDGLYNIDSAVLKNRLVVMADDGWRAFVDPYLLDFCNGEVITAAIESPWASSLDRKWAVADNFFLNARRKLRRISVAVSGNPAMDVGDLVKLSLLTSTAVSKYLIVAISSNFSPDGYIDQVELEYVSGSDAHICEPAEGKYAPSSAAALPLPDSPDSDSDLLVALSLPDRIVDFAKSFLGKLYQHGGNFPNPNFYGIDSSHLVFQVFSHFDPSLTYMPIDSLLDWAVPISRVELSPGDLVFYDNADNITNHVAIYIGNNQIIGAIGGDSKTTSRAVAIAKNANVKIQDIDYRAPSHFARPPLLPS